MGRVQRLGRPQYRVFALTLLLFLTVATSASTQSSPNTFPATGNVGIGTTSPIAPLEVRSGTNRHFLVRSPADLGSSASGVALQSANDAYSVNLPLTIESSGLFLNASTQGFVGIGTNTPQSTLDVRAGANRHLLVRSPAELGLGVAGVALQSADDLSRVNLPISVESSGLYLNVSTQGRVGIGTTNPQAQLHVAGSVQADGNIAAKYQDIAEWVPAVTKLSQGVVVVIDPGLGSRVQASDRPYDVHVVGVVSDRPGVLLGESADDKVKIAHSGRVKVKVDASYGPVVPGDLLVTSPTRGHAMRSTPVAVGEASLHRPGTLIGKALEPLNEGQGEILVLLILQ